MIDNVISAYEAVKMNGVSQGIIALCSFIAVIIVIQKFVTAWKEAIVSGDQKITNGSVIKLVTLQEMQLPGGMVINKGTAVFGVVKLAQDRINITVESVRIGNSIYEMQKTVYDRDGLPGIYVPLNIKAEATKEAADEVVSDMNVTSYGTDVLSTGVNAVSNAAKSVFRKKNNQVVVTVKSNYKLYLK